MATMIVKFDNHDEKLIQAFETFLSNINSVKYELLNKEENELLDDIYSLKESIKDIKDGKGYKTGEYIQLND